MKSCPKKPVLTQRSEEGSCSMQDNEKSDQQPLWLQRVLNWNVSLLRIKKKINFLNLFAHYYFLIYNCLSISAYSFLVHFFLLHPSDWSLIVISLNSSVSTWNKTLWGNRRNLMALLHLGTQKTFLQTHVPQLLRMVSLISMSRLLTNFVTT